MKMKKMTAQSSYTSGRQGLVKLLGNPANGGMFTYKQIHISAKSAANKNATAEAVALLVAQGGGRLSATPPARPLVQHR